MAFWSWKDKGVGAGVYGVFGSFYIIGEVVFKDLYILVFRVDCVFFLRIWGLRLIGGYFLGVF